MSTQNKNNETKLTANQQKGLAMLAFSYFGLIPESQNGYYQRKVEILTQKLEPWLRAPMGIINDTEFYGIPCVPTKRETYTLRKTGMPDKTIILKDMLCPNVFVTTPEVVEEKKQEGLKLDPMHKLVSFLEENSLIEEIKDQEILNMLDFGKQGKFNFYKDSVDPDAEYQVGYYPQIPTETGGGFVINTKAACLSKSGIQVLGFFREQLEKNKTLSPEELFTFLVEDCCSEYLDTLSDEEFDNIVSLFKEEEVEEVEEETKEQEQSHQNDNEEKEEVVSDQNNENNDQEPEEEEVVNQAQVESDIDDLLN